MSSCKATNANVPVRVRYRHTHWIATIDHPHPRGRGIFDVNCVGSGGDGWTTLSSWRTIVVPWITNGIKGADGTWSITHGIEVDP